MTISKPARGKAGLFISADKTIWHLQSRATAGAAQIQHPIRIILTHIMFYENSRKLLASFSLNVGCITEYHLTESLYGKTK